MLGTGEGEAGQDSQSSLKIFLDDAQHEIASLRKDLAQTRSQLDSAQKVRTAEVSLVSLRPEPHPQRCPPPHPG